MILSKYAVLIVFHVYFHIWILFKIFVYIVSALLSYWSHFYFLLHIKNTWIYQLLHVNKPMWFKSSINRIEYTKLINILLDNLIWRNIPFIYIFLQVVVSRKNGTVFSIFYAHLIFYFLRTCWAASCQYSWGKWNLFFENISHFRKLFQINTTSCNFINIWVPQVYFYLFIFLFLRFVIDLSLNDNLVAFFIVSFSIFVKISPISADFFNRCSFTYYFLEIINNKLFFFFLNLMNSFFDFNWIIFCN